MKRSDLADAASGARATRTSVFFILLFLIGRTVASEPARPASIDGFVTGTGATVLGGVAIGVNELNEGRYQQAVSDHAGYYRVDHLTSGAYSIWAEAKGYGCIVYPNLALFPGQHLHQNFHFESARESAKTCEAQRSHHQ